ncbi:uncharacterized protein EI97DRAFT_293468 [Westerdykella ornata]|uniref:SWI5-dependent HO expression protein 3 n=1 Tax=Westerdykella ornata TaxID=318751 RepID=A0A6A6JMM3_WESOR|nr:uncharacterized protein EI97DRAFT_293468 [Westerdykella ornata]KAF2277475.1 hypothetical protein EI97DRAFT_293468 [Westerdykella ornata]
MNGNIPTTWSYEEAARTVNAPPPASETTSKPVTSPQHKSINATPMAVLTASRTSAGPLPVENPAPSNGADTTGWRTNPHATPNSKTSQYIDKITAENERLRRELKAERLAREDEAKRVSAAKVKAEDSRAEQQHLQVLADANARAIERKDRKIEELKAALEAESKRRQAAESKAEEALRLLGENRSQTQAQLAQAYESMHRADTSALAAKDGYDRKIKAYEELVKGMKKDIKELKRQRLEDDDRIKRQGIISDQLQHEVSRTLAREGAMRNLMEEYKKEKEKEVDELVEEAERMRRSLPEKEREAEELVRELREARDKMKWVIAQRRRQDEEGD